MVETDFDVTGLNLTQEERRFLEEAAVFFINPGLVVKGLNWIGKPIETLHSKLPDKARKTIAKSAQKAIEAGLVAAIQTASRESPQEIDRAAQAKLSQWLHKGVATATGAAGGLIGLAALPVELPLSTVLILRGIADQARIHGYGLQDAQTQLECLMVFSFGSGSAKDDEMESSYFTTRLGLSQILREATHFVGTMATKELLRTIESGSAPILVRLIAKVAEAFEVRVTQKLMAETVPVAGAFGGGLVNYMFTDFFCAAARFHFGIRSLEDRYGQERVQTLFRQITADVQASRTKI